MTNLLPHTCKTKAHHDFNKAMSEHNIKFAMGGGIDFRSMLKIFNRIEDGKKLLNEIEKDGNILHPDTIKSLKCKVT
jgi:hypothetical protein